METNQCMLKSVPVTHCPDTLNILMYMFCGPYFGKVIKLPIYNTYLL